MFSNITYSWGVGGGGGRGANTYGIVHKKNMLHQQWPGPGFKRNPMQDVAENRKDTEMKRADVS
jgi:hypothetical protein